MLPKKIPVENLRLLEEITLMISICSLLKILESTMVKYKCDWLFFLFLW